LSETLIERGLYMNDQQKKILIIEDDMYTRDLYKETLEGAGYHITVAMDGLEGFTKIQSETFDLVLCDAMMPRMDGLTVLTKLKEQSTIPHPKIALCTNLAGDGVINNALALGAVGCLIKTEMNPDQLVARVGEFLK